MAPAVARLIVTATGKMKPTDRGGGGRYLATSIRLARAGALIRVCPWALHTLD